MRMKWYLICSNEMTEIVVRSLQFMNVVVAVIGMLVIIHRLLDFHDLL